MPKTHLVQIKHRKTGDVIIAENTDRMRRAVEAAIRSHVDLREADLCRANLRDAVLRRANLSGVDLRRANLRAADLRHVDLVGADLREADLTCANLHAADLRHADLRDAVLHRADLHRADLRDADLRHANLSDTDLRETDLRAADLRGADLGVSDLSTAALSPSTLRAFRDDFWAVLSSAPNEVVGLRNAIVLGRVKGSTYRGECACLVGTIANVRQCDVNTLGTLEPNPNRPAEVFFLGISLGDTPTNNLRAQLVLEWLDEWVAGVKSVFSGKKAMKPKQRR